MLGLLLERLNSKLKKTDEKSSENSLDNVRSHNEYYSPYSNSNLISMSPATNIASTPQNYPKNQPVTYSLEESFRLGSEHKKMRNPSPITSKKLYDDQETFQNIKLKVGRREDALVTPRFGLDADDKESILNTLGSIFESTKEGSFLAQNIPVSTAMTANKFNTGNKGGMTARSPYNQDLYAREEFSQRNYQRKEGTIESARGGNELQRSWEGWWIDRKKNSELLLEASKYNLFEICRQLLDKAKGDSRGDVNYKGENGWTPLHFACLNGNTELVGFFLDNQAEIDAETSLKFTALHIAAQKGHTSIVEILINTGADFNARDIFQNTALHYAAQNGHKGIVALLLRKPSMDLNIRNNDNKIAYALAFDFEIRKMFEIFMAEKNLLAPQSVQKVTIHTINSTNRSALLDPENVHDRTGNTLKVPTGRKGQFELDERRISSQKSHTTGDTKANSSLNTTQCEQANISMEEEKVGPHHFKVHGMIGKGSFGEVFLVEKKNTNTLYAMKVLHKSRISKHNLINYAMTERNVLGVTNHSFIVKLNYAFQTPEKLFLILDYCPGGDLGAILQREKRFSEEKARFYLAEVLLALEDLHKRDIIFRDLKPDNIVIDAEGHAKLTDFGLSKEGVLDHSEGARSFCGSVAYLAPEMLRRTGHGKAVDWYLLGVVFYEMLVGVPPYYANNREEMFYNIERAPLKVPSHLSMEAKSLLKGLLQRNVTRRLGSGNGDAEEIKAHEFFKGIDWKAVEQRKMKPPAVEKKVNVTKVTYDVFDVDDGVGHDARKIDGWSFVAQKGNQSSEKRFF